MQGHDAGEGTGQLASRASSASGALSRRTGALARAVAAMLVGIGVLFTSPALGDDGFDPLPATPGLVPAAMEEAPTDSEEVEAPTPTEVTASEQQFNDLSDSEALAVAKENFGWLFSAEFIPELDLPESSEISRYIDLYSARVVPKNGPSQAEQVLSGEPSSNLLLESGLPLRAPEGGALRPLDATLMTAGGDAYEAANPVVEAKIAEDLTEGATLRTENINVAPVGVDDTNALPVNGRVFYPNALEDTDYAIAPTATGFEIFMQIRSPSSPESFPLDLDVPQGAVLVATAGGGAEVRRGSELIATIEAPSASDAAGQLVPVEYEISGDNLDVHVAHRSGNYELPIMVDPPVNGNVDEYAWVVGNESLDTRFWHVANTSSTLFTSFASSVEGGLVNRAVGGYSFPANSYAQWVADSIRYSYIERIDYLDFDRSPTSPGNCTYLGIYQPWTGNFAPTTFFNPATNTSTYSAGMGYCSNSAHESRSVWAGANAMPDGPGGDPEAGLSSQGIFQLNSSSGYRSQRASNLLRHAKVYRYDDQPTNITSPVPSSNWTRGPITMSVQDWGLGAAGVWVFRSGSFDVIGSAGSGCSAIRENTCPVDATFQVNNLPEGRQDVVAVGIDPVLNGGPAQSWTARIDRSAPATTKSGDVAAIPAGGVLPDGDHTYKVTATDGSATSAAAERAGVTSLTMTLDGATVATKQQSCQASSCAAQVSYSFNSTQMSVGAHTLQVTATDAAGNTSVSRKEFVINPPIRAVVDWIDPADGEQFTTSQPNDGTDPYVLSPLPAAPEYDRPECSDGPEPVLNDPYNDELPDEPCDLVVEGDYFDEEAVPIPDSEPDLRLRVDVAEAHGLGSVGRVSLLLDEAPFGADCYVATCTWTVPRQLVLPGKHELQVVARDQTGANISTRQLVLMDGYMINPIVPLAASAGGRYVADAGATQAAIEQEYQEGATLEALGVSVDLTPAMGSDALSGQVTTPSDVAFRSTASTEVKATTTPVVNGIRTTVRAANGAGPEVAWDLSLAGQPSAVEDAPGNAVILTRSLPAVEIPDAPAPDVDGIDEDYALPAGVGSEIEGSPTPAHWSAGASVGSLEEQILTNERLAAFADSNASATSEPIAVLELVSATGPAGESLPATLGFEAGQVGVDIADPIDGPVEVRVELSMVAPLSFGSQCMHAFNQDLAAMGAGCFQESTEDRTQTDAGTSEPVTRRHYDTNTKERDWCLSHGGPSGGLCEEYQRARSKATTVTNQVYTAHASDTKSNAFLHMFWVTDMINRNPESRAEAKNLYTYHEWEDSSIDQYGFKMNVQAAADSIRDAGYRPDVSKLKSIKRSSQMDMLNNYVSHQYTPKGHAIKYGLPRFCIITRNHAHDAKFLGHRASPYKWAGDHQSAIGSRAVFRYVKFGGLRPREVKHPKRVCAQIPHG